MPGGPVTRLPGSMPPPEPTTTPVEPGPGARISSIALRAKRAVVWAALTSSAVALAYVLPAGLILKKVAVKRGVVQVVAGRGEGSLGFCGRAVRGAGRARGLPIGRREVVAYGSVGLKLPGRCRIELASVEGGKQLAAVLSTLA